MPGNSVSKYCFGQEIGRRSWKGSWRTESHKSRGGGWCDVLVEYKGEKWTDMQKKNGMEWKGVIGGTHQVKYVTGTIGFTLFHDLISLGDHRAHMFRKRKPWGNTETAHLVAGFIPNLDHSYFTSLSFF
jgi:hypothetical protein